MKRLWMITLLCILMALGGGLVIGNAQNDGDGINITISPSVLVLGEDDGSNISVHSNIKPDAVETDSLRLANEDGKEIKAISTFTDNQGDLVLKFKRDDVEGIVKVGEVKLTLRGKLTGEDEAKALASDTIKVKKDAEKKRSNEKKKTGKD